jgi:hypothetical protein
MNKQWIYRNGDKPFSVTEIVMPDGSMCFTSVHVQGFLMLHYGSGKVLEVGRDLDLIPYEPYSDYVIDDKVNMSDVENCSIGSGHFAGLTDDGKPTTFRDGGTSFTRKPRDRWEWNFCEKAAPKEDK